MEQIKNIFEPSTNSDPAYRAMDALSVVRQFQQDWQDFGTDRVHRYFDNVDGNWIEEFNKNPVFIGSLSAPYGNIKGSAYLNNITINMPKQFVSIRKRRRDRALKQVSKRLRLRAITWVNQVVKENQEWRKSKGYE